MSRRSSKPAWSRGYHPVCIGHKPTPVSANEKHPGTGTTHIPASQCGIRYWRSATARDLCAEDPTINTWGCKRSHEYRFSPHAHCLNDNPRRVKPPVFRKICDKQRGKWSLARGHPCQALGTGQSLCAISRAEELWVFFWRCWGPLCFIAVLNGWVMSATACCFFWWLLIWYKNDPRCCSQGINQCRVPI